MQHQLPIYDRGAQLGVQGQLPRPDPGHARVPDTHPFAVALGRVQRRIRGWQQRVDAGAVHRGDGDPGACLDLDVDPVDPERTTKLVDHRPADRAHLVVRGIGAVGQVDPAHDDRELVAAETAGEGGVHGDAAQPLGKDLEQPVSGGVPQGVVDLTEAVDVEQDENRLPAGRERRGDHRLCATDKPGPIRKCRQRVPVHQEFAPAGEPEHHQGSGHDRKDDHCDQRRRTNKITLDDEPDHHRGADEHRVAERDTQPGDHRSIARHPGIPEEVHIGRATRITVGQRSRDRENRGEHQDAVHGRSDPPQ